MDEIAAKLLLHTGLFRWYNVKKGSAPTLRGPPIPVSSRLHDKTKGARVMPVNVSDHGQLVYISYHRQEFKDSDQLKKVLGNQASTLIDKDVVVDFSSCNSLTSPEIGAVVRLLQAFQGSTRYLRIVTNPDVRKTLESTNVIKLQNLVIYDNQQQFIEEVKKSAEQKDP